MSRAPLPLTAGAGPPPPPARTDVYTPDFPDDDEGPTVETGLMVRTARRTMSVTPGGGFAMWCGPSRAGKSRTARWLADKLAAACDTNPRAFYGVHYECAATPPGRDGMKRGVQSLYSGTIAPMSETVYRQMTAETMAVQWVGGMRARRQRVAFLDEAGLLSIDALSGLALARDVAENAGWPVTLVLIGMDALPTRIKERPQVANRVHEWCYFTPYSLEETHELLGALHPHFAALDLDRPADRAQVSFVHEQFGGLPGLLVPFLRRLGQRAREMRVPIDLTVLRAVHLMTARDEQAAERAASAGYAPTADPGSVTTPKRGRRPRGARPGAPPADDDDGSAAF